ncbi:MAG: GNAT family N-acetyltransferase [Ktedonobacteraceae bacterium]
MVMLETSRLLLRPIAIENLQEKYLIGRHPDYYEFDGFERLPDGSKRSRTLEETRKKLEERIGEFALQGFGQWAVVLKETRAFIGWAGLQFYLLDHGTYSTPEIELFYGLSRVYWGQGLITEASGKLVHYGFHTLKLQRITGCTARQNFRSQAVMKRMGMTVGAHPSESESLLGVLDNPALAGITLG